MAEPLPPENALRRLLGILNFSSSDVGPPLVADVSAIYAAVAKGQLQYATFVERRDAERAARQANEALAEIPAEVATTPPAATLPPTWQAFRHRLNETLDRLEAEEPAFADTRQARQVIAFAFDRLPTAYLRFHRETLGHLTSVEFWQAGLVARLMAAALETRPAEGSPAEAKHGTTTPPPEGADEARRGEGDVGRWATAAVARLNDYLGYRPVASLETQKTQPYPHEYVGVVPLYLKGVGALAGPYQEVITRALALLAETDEAILAPAQYDPDGLIELAVDPRAYDFDHPVNKRPNYHFGLWDPTRVSLSGRYERFVIQDVTLDSLMVRTLDERVGPPDERLTEAAAVLAGIVLMASGISGSGPGAHDSTVQLPALLPRIARYRDRFYEWEITRLQGHHRDRLDEEAVRLRQPFAGARQSLNAELAGRRSAQLERVALARVFARLGYASAAKQEIAQVATPAARMACAIDCHLDAADQALLRGEPAGALSELATVMRILPRGIACGAIVDPWNILGFDASFPLFEPTDASTHDHRADELAAWMDQIFSLHARVWSEAASRSDEGLAAAVETSFDAARSWWLQFAAHEVSSIDAPDGDDAFKAAELVASALRLWHEGGAAAGNIGFWASHTELFDSPRAYSLVIDALLARGDFVSSMALLIRWISEAETVGLSGGERPFGDVVIDWLHRLTGTLHLALVRDGQPAKPPTSPPPSALPQLPTDGSPTAKRPGEESVPAAFDRVGAQARKCLDFLEANAGPLWRVPDFQPPSSRRRRDPQADPLDPSGDVGDDDPDLLFDAAYEDVVYQDSTDDGFQGSVFDPSARKSPLDEDEIKRIDEHLGFLGTLATLWKMTALVPAAAVGRGIFPEASLERDQWRETTRRWTEEAVARRAELFRLADAVDAWELPKPTSDPDALIEYDRQRYNKESLQDRIISTCVEMADAARLLLAVESGLRPPGESAAVVESFLTTDERKAVEVLGLVLRGDVPLVRQQWADLVAAVSGKSLLYVPLSKGGRPRAIVDARVWQRTVQDLLHWLPRMGMIRETCSLLDIARQMERDNPVGPGAVTEFDELFRLGCLSLVRSVVHFSRTWPDDSDATCSKVVDSDSTRAEPVESDAHEPDAHEPETTGTDPTTDPAASQHDSEASASKPAAPLATDDEPPPPEEATSKPASRPQPSAKSKPASETTRSSEAKSSSGSKPPSEAKPPSDSEPSPDPLADGEPGVTPLIVGLRKLLERLLPVWLEHSETLRLSVLEKVREPSVWERLVRFIQTYGDEIFSQRFFNLGNIRAILHQGVASWLEELEKNPPPGAPQRLLTAIETKRISRGEAVEALTLVLEAVVENYTEYRDYNSTTTQSDRGEMVYTLLDFLRLRTRYDRVAWRLRPVIWTHEVLIRDACDTEAEFWRQSIQARVQDEAESHLDRLRELQARYAMRMPSIEDRLREKFLRPLLIDRLRALVRPSFVQRTDDAHPAFESLQSLAQQMIEERGGIGLDVPRWLVILDDEVEAVRRGDLSHEEADLWAVPWGDLSLRDILDQVRTPPTLPGSRPA